MGSLAKDLEIHGFTGTKGTRPNAAPVKENGIRNFLEIDLVDKMTGKKSDL